MLEVYRFCVTALMVDLDVVRCKNFSLVCKADSSCAG